MKLSAIIALALSLSAIARPLASPEPFKGGITNEPLRLNKRGRVIPSATETAKEVQGRYKKTSAKLKKLQGYKRAVDYYIAHARHFDPEETAYRPQLITYAAEDVEKARAKVQKIVQELLARNAMGERFD